MNIPHAASPRTLAGEHPDGERMLACFAAHVVGGPVQVVYNRRVTVPVTLQAATDTVVLDPDRTSLEDLLVAASLIRRRAEIRELCAARDAVAATIAAAWAAAGRREVHARLPKLAGRMAGWRSWCRPDDPTRAPRVVWETVPLEPLAARGGPLGMAWHDGLSFSGAGGDWDVVLGRIRSGEIPARSLPGFPLPIVTMPFEMACPTATGADLERFDTLRRSMMDVQREWLQCYHRTSRDDRWTPADLRRYRQGKHLDESRLALAAVHARAGRPAAVFHRRRSASDHVFNPFDHLIAVGVDLNPAAGSSTLSDTAYRRTLGERHWRPDAIACMLNMFRSLGVRVGVTGFLDRVIDVDGRPHYLHLPLPLKEVDEPWTGRCHARLATLLAGARLRVPGRPAMLLPITLETVGSRVEAALAAGLPRHLRTYGIFGGGLPTAEKSLRPEAVNCHVAAAAEALLARWHSQWADLHFSSEGMYVPRELKDAATPGMRLRRMMAL